MITAAHLSSRKRAELRRALKPVARSAVLEIKVNQLESSAIDEDSQTDFCSDSPVTFNIGQAKRKRAGSYLRRHRAGALGLAAALTFSLLAEESHTASDHGSSGADSTDQSTLEPVLQRWRTTNVVVALDDSLKALGPDIERAIKGSFITWENTGAGLPAVEFIETSGAIASLKPDGQSTVLFAPIEFEGHESDLAITIGFSNPNTGEISEADIVINSRHRFASVQRSETLSSGKRMSSILSPEDQESCTGSLDAGACSASYDLPNVLTHEVGHFFGLGENYDEPRTTMFSCTSACEIHKRDLEPADVDSMIVLYIEQPTQPAAAGCSGVQMAISPVSTRSSAWLGWLALFSLGAWRRIRSHPLRG